ncbi:uncharacterized protein LOC122068744 [Macadamia integrifolia]|uniref:uncharacterized protein LOC122068744 n=1 Tax=Macadamia integrifolia TaxID=60698 RepID=UPI001C4EA331|nr:uncharacterized protein LOC122068744 [Macadamia integrifolia]
MVIQERLLVQKLQVLLYARESEIRQRARIKFLHEGDGNSEFFHQSLKTRRAHNSISTIQSSSGVMLTNDEEIRDEAVSYFSTAFMNTPQVVCGDFDIPIDRSLSWHEKDLLSQAFSMDDIKKVIFAAENDSAPGTDGFGACFYKATWDITGHDVSNAILDFFNNPWLPDQVKLSRLTLIPKGDHQNTFSDYRPIAVSSFIYQFIAKLLANRLKLVLHKLVGINQSAFTEGRQIYDNILLCQDLLHDYHLNKGMPRFAAKLDLRKVYDSVQWSFLFTLLNRLNFPSQFINWVVPCITNPSYVIFLNGAQSHPFYANRGLRQGCPMSPFLFNIVLQVFSDSLSAAAKSGVFRYHQLCEKPEISSICFVDDLFVFGKGDDVSAGQLDTLLSRFSAISGLAINKGKSAIYFANCSTALQNQLSQIIGILPGQLPIRYLGVPLHSRSLRSHEFNELISKVEARLSSWKAKALSYAGRLTLIQSVITGMIAYWLNVFKLPKGTLDQLERIMARFLWWGHATTGSYKVAWSVVCTPKEEGGLGLRRLCDWNSAALMRHVWNIASNMSSSWSRFVRCRWLRRHSIWSLPRPTVCSQTFNAILSTRDIAVTCCKSLIHTGHNTLLWYDPWLPNGPLCSDGSLIVEALGRNPYETVSALLSENGVWDEGHQDPIILNRWTEIANTRSHSRLSMDQTVWTHSSSGLFSISSAWNVVRRPGAMVNWHHLIWFRYSHPRFAFIAWLARYTLPSWSEEVSWLCQNVKGDSVVSSVQSFCFSAVVYRIWCERNNRIFKSESTNVDELFHRIVSDTRGRFCHLQIRTAISSSIKEFFHRWKMKPEFLSHPLQFFSWPRPPAAWLVLNCDGSIRKGLGGYGVVARDARGCPVFALAGAVVHDNILCVELIAIRQGLKRARDRRCTHLQVRSDSLATVQMITGKFRPPWFALALLDDIFELYANFQHCVFSHHVREINRCADFLASFVQSPHETMLDLSNLSDDLIVLLSDDACGKANLEYACGQGIDCSPIQSGGACYEPITVASHAAYAMNRIYQIAGRNPRNCDFSQTAAVTSTNPSGGIAATSRDEERGEICSDERSRRQRRKKEEGEGRRASHQFRRR